MRLLGWKHLKAAAAALLMLFAFPLCQAGDKGLLYSVSKDGELRGYLLGTIHSDDPRLLDFSEAFTGALMSCDQFAMELVPNQPTLSRLMEYMHYQDGSTLESRVGESRYQRLLAAAGAYNLGPEQLSTMKIWAAMMTVSIPPPENGLFMDLSLALQAAGGGLKVIGLETLDDQLAFLEDMPEAQQLVLLDQALDEFGQLPELYAKLIDAYLQGDLEDLQAESDSQFEALPDDVESYFFSQGIDARNLRMRDRLVEQLDGATVFTAVGALHLPGELGLISLLRRAGFSVEPTPFTPFAE